MIGMLALLQLTAASPRTVAPGMTLRVAPDTVLVERSAVTTGARYLNFDFLITNGSGSERRLAAVRLSARDARGGLVYQRFCDGSGFSPCIAAVPERQLAATESAALYNPFHTLPGDIPLATLEYELIYTDSAGTATDTLRATITPREYANRTDLVLPLRGRLLVFDGHDFYAHHRRWPLSHPILQRLGFAGNGGRYAYDLSIVDSVGRMFRGDGARNEDWYGWNAPVLAPGGGIVVAAANDEPDWDVGRTSLPDSVIMARPLSLFGNYVVIDHGNGEYSLVAHMRRGSIRVQRAARVAQGE
ncbi:MAG: M23 family metallopeptidase, partial [Gemmatimonadota bacterium]